MAKATDFPTWTSRFAASISRRNEYSHVTRMKSDSLGRFSFSNLEKPERSEEGHAMYCVIAWSSRPSKPAQYERLSGAPAPLRLPDAGRGDNAWACCRYCRQASRRGACAISMARGLVRSRECVTARTDSNGEFAVTDLRPVQASDYHQEPRQWVARGSSVSLSSGAPGFREGIRTLRTRPRRR